MPGKAWYGIDCVMPFPFWRSNDLFARSLEVDVTQMEEVSQMVHVRTLREGSERHPSDNFGFVRYTLSYPDGSVVARDTLSLNAQHLSFVYDQWLSSDCIRGLKYLERRQCLVSLGYFPKGPGRLLMGVVDLESIAK